MTKKLMAVAPDGTRFTRKTNRPYKFVVLTRDDFAYLTRLAEAGPRSFEIANYWYHRAILDGTHQHCAKRDYETEEQAEQRLARMREAALRFIGRATCEQEFKDAWKSDHLASLAKRVRADAYTLAGWCSRADLAIKLQRQQLNRPSIREAIIANVVPVKPA